MVEKGGGVHKCEYEVRNVITGLCECECHMGVGVGAYHDVCHIVGVGVDGAAEVMPHSGVDVYDGVANTILVRSILYLFRAFHMNEFSLRAMDWLDKSGLSIHGE